MCTENITVLWFCVWILEASLGFQHWHMCESLFLFFLNLVWFCFKALQEFRNLLNVRKF